MRRMPSKRASVLAIARGLDLLKDVDCRILEVVAKRHTDTSCRMQRFVNHLKPFWCRGKRSNLNAVMEKFQ